MIAATVLGVLSTGGLTVHKMIQEKKGKEKLQVANAMMDKGDLGTAEAIAMKLVEDFEEGPVGGRARDLINRIRSRRAAELRTKKETRLKFFHKELSHIADLFEKGAIADSLLAYKKLFKTFEKEPSFKKRIQDSLSARFGEFKNLLAKEEEKAKGRELPDLNKFYNLEEKENALRRIQNSFPEKRAESVRDLRKALARMPSLAKLKGFPPELGPLLGKWLEAEKRVGKLRSALRKEIGLDHKKRELDRPFLKAQEAEKAKNFEEALRLYRKLAKEYHGDQSLMAFFRRQANKYERVTTVLGQIEEARKKGEFFKGKELFEELQFQFPQLSLQDRILLPFKIETFPVSATVFVKGKKVGKTPITLSLHPGEESKVLLRREGFREEAPSSELLAKGKAHSVLTLLPRWKTRLKGALTEAPLLWKKTLYLSDHSGRLTLLDPKTGKKQKELFFKDPAGNFSRPRPLGNGILLISRDGPVRKIRSDGSLLWETKLKGPLLLGAGIWAKRLLLFSEDGTETFLDPESGEILFSQDGRPKRVRPFQSSSGEVVIVVDREGWVQALSSDGSELWRTKVEEAGYARPFVHGSWVLVPSDDLGLHGLQLQTGAKKWRVRLGDGLRGPVSFGCDDLHVYVATRNRELFKIDLEKGKSILRVPIQGLPSGRVRSIGGLLFVSLSQRGPQVFEPKALRHMAWLEGKSGSEAPVVLGLPGQILVGRSSGEVASFPLSQLQ
ncbi:MAG TPA: PEGA domain-containing protein [Planctomycetes bacterium]|nr:PEGA domain-containing protein [Planctomycetota bacterium]